MVVRTAQISQLTESELQTSVRTLSEHCGSLCDTAQCKVLPNQVCHRYKDRMTTHVTSL